MKEETFRTQAQVLLTFIMNLGIYIQAVQNPKREPKQYTNPTPPEKAEMALDLSEVAMKITYSQDGLGTSIAAPM